MKNIKTLVILLFIFLLVGSIYSIFPVAYAADGEFVSTDTTLAFQGIDVSSSGVIYAGARDTIYRSADEGQTWIALHTFSGVTEIGCVFVADNGYVYAVPSGRTITDSDRGIWRSVDSGSTWSRVLTLDPTSESTVMWGFDQDNSGYLFAGIYTYSSDFYNTRIYRSTDNGATWNSVYYDSTCRHFHDLKVDRTSGYIYATTGDGALPPNKEYILRSRDGGNNWEEILSGLPQCVAISITPGARYFGSDTGIANGAYIYRTTDDTTYSTVYSETSGYYVVAWIKRDPVSGQMFASLLDQSGTTPSKILTSVDGGNTWTTYRTFSSLGVLYGSWYASRFVGQTMYYSLTYATYQNGVKLKYVPPPAPEAVVYKISVNAQQHDDYGLGYPVTYVFEIPASSANLKAYIRYSAEDSWSQLAQKTSSDFFNGIECVRFDYATHRAYVSVAFSGGSDDIYVRLTDVNGSLIESLYLGVSEYYDNRKAAVTASDDDWDGYFTGTINAAADAYQSRSIWFTGGFITQGYPYTPPLSPDWVNAQAQINQGYVEAASHSRTHAQLPYPDYTSEIGGSKTDIVGNLILPSTYSIGGTEYVWAWLEPWGTSDATVRQRLSQYKYLVSRSYYDKDVIDWATWDSANGLFNRAGITVEMGTYAEHNLAVLNGKFDTAYNAGGIYHLMTHHIYVDWTPGSYALQHLDYIDGRSDVWYVGFGALYAYHYIDTVANLSVQSINPNERGLTINSAHGSPNPSVGVHYYSDGASVTASVSSPVVEGSLVWTCTGWTGTGSVPATGSGNSVTFTITENSAITWNWASSPALSLTVVSPHGNPSPNGVTYYATETSVTASVSSPVVEGSLVWTCTGWTGTGSVPATGSGNSVTFTITGDSSIVWNWISAPVEYTLTVTISGSGSVSTSPDQVTYHYGDVVRLTATPANGWSFSSWSGALSGSTNPASLTITDNMAVTATFTKDIVGTIFFSDGFESGNFASWTGTSGTPTVQNSVKHHNTYAMFVNANPEYTYRDLGSSYGTVYARVYVRFSALPWAQYYAAPFLVLGNSAHWPYATQIETYNYDGTHCHFRLSDGAGPSDEGTTIIALDTWYCVELKRVTGSGLSVMYINGVEEGSVGFGYYDTNRVQVGGAFSLSSAGYIDCVVVADAQIGMESAAPPTRSLTVTSNHGSPSPAVGVHFYADGSSITASVSSPVVEGSLVWTCTGWTGTGSVPSNGNSLSAAFTIVSDSSITWNWVSAPVNSAPVLDPIGNKNIAELTLLTFTATASDIDIPPQSLTFGLSGTVPSGASITSGGVFTWTPSEAQGPASYTFDVIVSDGTLTDSETITVTVNEVNLAPTVAAINDISSHNELALLSFTAPASDPDIPANTMTFSLIGETYGATITSGGIFSWTPSELQGLGDYSFTVRVTDNGGLYDDEVFSVHVNEVNVAPILGTIGDRSVNELALLTFTATATDADLPANTLTFSLAGNIPTGATINSVTGLFSWTPTEVQSPGSYTFDVIVSDGITTDSETITVTVSEVNTAPILSGVPTLATIPELAAYSFTASATDADLPANTLTYSLSGAPAGAGINPSTGVFNWIPSESQGPGEYTFNVIVSDGLATDTKTITLTISEVNTAPTVNPIDDITSHDELVVLSFTATAADPDLPADTLTFSLVGNAYGATINPISGLFSWTPTETQGPGDYTFTVRATDSSGLFDAEVFSVHVNEVNAAPVLANIGPQTVNELTLLTFTASASDFDLPPQTLSYSLAGTVPSGAAITPSGIFSWTPSEAQGPNSYTFTVVVSDGALTDSETITVTVADVNVAPVLATIGNRNVNEGVSLDFTATATDADVPVQTLSFSLVGAPSGATINPTTGVFTWAPTEVQGPGSYTFIVRVNDNGTPSLSDEEEITVTVSEANVAPILSTIGSQTGNELTLISFTASATDADLPANTLTFSLVNAPLGATINSATGAFTWTPTEAQGPGIYSFDVAVSDGALTDSETITITVNEGNVAPVLSGVPTSASIPEMTTYSFTASATDADLPANILTFSLVGAPSGASINPTTGVFTWAPTEAQGPSSYTFNVVVSDGTLTDSKSITVIVSEVNSAPVLATIGSRSIAEGSLLSFTAVATDSDVPAQTLRYSLSGSVPVGAVIDSSTGVFSWTPIEVQGPGSYMFDVVVSDGALTDSETITVTVSEVNVAPVLGAIGSHSGNELTLITFTAAASDADNTPQDLVFSLTGTVPSGATISATTGVFTWIPSETQGPGSYTFTVVVSDGILTDSEEITVTVSEVNLPPVLSGVPASANIPEMVAYGFTASATDSDIPAQTLTYSLVGAPSGASINSATGVFSWTPTESQNGLYSFKVRVTDGVVNVDADISLTVTEVNVAPVLGAIGSRPINEGTLLTFTATASDSDLPAQTLTFSLDAGAPAGASINPTTGVFSWIPSENQAPGSFSITVLVTDNGVPTLDDFETIVVTVNEVNVAPELTMIGPQTVNEGSALTFTASASDVDLPAQTLTFSLANGISGSIPTGATINPSTGAFTWTPSEAQGPGSYTFDVVVSDGSLTDYETITVTVREVNVPPVLSNVPISATIPEGTPYSFDADASDSDLPANTLTFSLAGSVPAGASINSGTGVFAWTPTEAQGGQSYTFDVVVFDGALSGSETITVTVSEVNVPPVLVMIGPKGIAEGSLLTFTATATDVDIPAQTLTYSLSGTVPAGASINPTTGVFNWSPTEPQGPNSYTFDVIVSDGVASDSETITITVSEVNVPPVLSGVPTSATIPEMAAYSFTALATDSDLPANTLVFSLVNAPSGASIDPVTGVFAWIPTETQGPGMYNFKVRVSDGVVNVDSDISLTITEVNVAPIVGAIDDVASHNELTQLSLTATATDPDVPANAFSFSFVGETYGAVIDSITGVFRWTPSEVQGPGDYSFTVRATDTGGLFDDEVFSVHVNEANVAPVLGAIGPQTIAEGDLLTFTAAATDADVPVQGLTYSLSGTVPSGASITTSGVFAWTPTGAQGPRSYMFDVVVSDGALTDSETITVTVSAVPFTITVVQSANGMIAPGSTVVYYGDNQAFTITPNTGYHIVSITVDGSPITVTSPTGQVFSFTDIRADHTITASFGINRYTITVTQTAHGTIAPGTIIVDYGTTPSFTITPDTGYHIISITVNGAPVTVASPKGQTYQFSPVSNDDSLTATYAIDTFIITPSAGSGGSISPNTAQTVNYGTTPSFTVTANLGYRLLDVRVDGLSVLGQLINGVYTFPPVVTNHEIATTFTQDVYSITASVIGLGGTINPSGVVSVVAGSSQAFAIEPDPGYIIVDVVVDGISQGAVSQYTFNAVSMNHSIIASFRQGTYTITASVDGTGGTINPSGAVLVNGGENATFTITPDIGYHILNVMVDGVYMGPQASFTFYEVDSSHTITAIFAKNEYTLTIVIVGSGHVSTNPNKISYSYGDQVSLTAIPGNKNFYFGYWRGALTGNTNPATIVMDSNKTVTATFLRTPK